MSRTDASFSSSCDFRWCVSRLSRHVGGAKAFEHVAGACLRICGCRAHCLDLVNPNESRVPNCTFSMTTRRDLFERLCLVNAWKTYNDEIVSWSNPQYCSWCDESMETDPTLHATKRLEEVEDYVWLRWKLKFPLIQLPMPSLRDDALPMANHLTCPDSEDSFVFNTPPRSPQGSPDVLCANKWAWPSPPRVTRRMVQNYNRSKKPVRMPRTKPFKLKKKMKTQS